MLCHTKGLKHEVARVSSMVRLMFGVCSLSPQFVLATIEHELEKKNIFFVLDILIAFCGVHAKHFCKSMESLTSKMCFFVRDKGQCIRVVQLPSPFGFCERDGRCWLVLKLARQICRISRNEVIMVWHVHSIFNELINITTV